MTITTIYTKKLTDPRLRLRASSMTVRSEAILANADPLTLRWVAGEMVRLDPALKPFVREVHR